MTRLELIQKIENRKKQINISIENLAKLSHLGVRTVSIGFFNTLLIAVWIKLSSSIKKPFIIVFWSIQLYQKVAIYGT